MDSLDWHNLPSRPPTAGRDARGVSPIAVRSPRDRTICQGGPKLAIAGRVRCKPEAAPANRPPGSASPADGDGGSALVLALLLLMALASLSAGLVLMTGTEEAIAAQHHASIRLRYAAEAGIELGIGRLRRANDWSQVLTPPEMGTLPPPGPGSSWRLLEEHRLSELTSPARDTGERVRTWVSDDEEPDGDPARDHNQRLLLQAEATGTRGTRQVVRAVVSRATDGSTSVMRLLSWHTDQR